MDKILEKTLIIIPMVYPTVSVDEEEIASLAYSADADVKHIEKVKVREVNPATYIGSGKLAELKDRITSLEIETVIFDGELSPSQTLNMSAALDDVKVIDRTTLILDIFAFHAQSPEGKLQVELAQLKYIYPRLKGKGDALSRLGGGIGTRGPGETQLETDRRHIRRRINTLEQELVVMKSRRDQQHERRKKNSVKTIALVGYTNAGKSTLFNALSGANVLTQDKLFATLDPTSRKLKIKDINLLLVDTVGFIRNLPHNLVEAFKSTLESAINADLIIEMSSYENWEYELQTTENTLSELESTSPRLIVINKCEEKNLEELPKDAICISALTGLNVDKLLEKIYEIMTEYFVTSEITVPYARYSDFNKLNCGIQLISVDYLDDGVKIKFTTSKAKYGIIEKFLSVE